MCKCTLRYIKISNSEIFEKFLRENFNENFTPKKISWNFKSLAITVPFGVHILKNENSNEPEAIMQAVHDETMPEC